MNRLSIRTFLALSLALALPLQGLALGVQNVVAPSHFHPSALAEGVGHVHDRHEGEHEHADAHEQGHGPAAPHSHALDDEDVVYVVGEHDPSSPAGSKLPPLDGVPRAASVMPAAAAPEAAPPVVASTGPLRSRSVGPLRRPPRRA